MGVVQHHDGVSGKKNKPLLLIMLNDYRMVLMQHKYFQIIIRYSNN